VGELDLPGKFSKYSKTMVIINNVLKPSLLQKRTLIRIYKTLARPLLCYGSEAWTIRKCDESRITACEMKFMCQTSGCTKWDLKTYEEVLKELRVEPILDYVCRYQNSWREHVNRISRTRIPKATMYYQPRGKRSLGRPMRR
jgi:hypothetical protein